MSRGANLHLVRSTVAAPASLGITDAEWQAILTRARDALRLVKKGHVYFLPRSKTVRVVDFARALTCKFRDEPSEWVGCYTWPLDANSLSEDLDAVIAGLGQ